MSESSNPDLADNQTQDGEIEMSAREAEIMALGRDFSTYTYNANFAVYIKLVHSREEAESDIRSDSFSPDFVHQFFVDQENIFGFKKPVIRLFYTAGRLRRYVKFDYEDRLTKERDNIDADDVMNALKPILEGLEYTQDLNKFINEVTSKEEQEFRPPGNLLLKFESEHKKQEHMSRARRELLEEAGQLFNIKYSDGQIVVDGNANSESQNENGGPSGSTINPPGPSVSSSVNGDDAIPVVTKKHYEIYHANHETKGFSQFQERMQTLVMWFIESANMVDFEDPRWDCFMIFEKYNPSAESQSTTPISTEDRYYFAGYATVYRYFAYPDRTRPRVAQMLILPPYKRNGLGTTLLQSIYDYYKTLPATLDITAEDPDEDFISMRDLLDCRNCLKLESFSTENLKKGWNDELAKEVQVKLKLCRRQARKVYEILKLRTIDKSDEEEYKNYRLEIKNRLNIPTQKLKIDVDRALKRDPNVNVPEELKPQDRVTAAKLEDNYRLLEKQYEHIIDKLNHPRAKIVAA